MDGKLKMILYGYLIELLVLFLWHKLIIKKEIIAENGRDDKILRRTIKLLIRYKDTIKNNILLRVKYKQGKEEEITRIKQYVMNLICIYVWIGCFTILEPAILVIFFRGKKTIFIFFTAYIYFSQLMIQTQNYTNTTGSYLNKVLIPLEKRPQIVEPERDEIINSQWNKKIEVIVVGIIGIAIGVLTIWVEGHRAYNKIFNVILFFLAILFLLIDYFKRGYIKRRLKKGISKKDVVFINAEYNMIEEDVKNICNILRIDNVNFKIIEENYVNAFSGLNADGIWEVSVTSQFITILRKMLEKENTDEKRDEVKRIFLVTVGHELGHVFYKDPVSIKKRVGIAFLISLVILGTAILMFVIGGKLFVCTVIGIILLFFNWIFGDIMCDIRYWEQISEFKADRIAVEYVHNGIQAFESFWLTEDNIQKEEKSTQNIGRENLIYKFYKRNIEIEGHPSKNRRRKLIEKRGTWKWWEYFEHALVIRKWRLLGLGWNGVLKVTKV
jgi:hypothetical protein